MHPLSANVTLVPSSLAILLVVTTTGSVQNYDRFMLIGLRERGTEQQAETDISSTIIPTANGTSFHGLTVVQRFQNVLQTEEGENL
jgi:hypothetical protein